MKLTVLKGVCDLNGFKMMPGCSCDVYAPISHIAASLTILNDSSEDDNLVALTQKSGIELSSLPGICELCISAPHLPVSLLLTIYVWLL